MHDDDDDDDDVYIGDNTATRTYNLAGLHAAEQSSTEFWRSRRRTITHFRRTVGAALCT